LTASARKVVTLDDKYTDLSGRIYLNGIQALVRLPMIQHEIDKARGLNTATFISGYRGSPLGGYDQALKSAQKHLDKHNIKFVPGVNEELGATAVWGSQQLYLNPGATVDGVVGIWYGKGPGVDRSLDAIKHANAAGTSKHGGVLALAGDDHACKSSTFPHQSEYALMHCMVPVLHPAGIEDGLLLGLHGIAMSRYSGCWTGLKIISDFADSSATLFTDPMALQFKTPTDFNMPKDGLNMRWYDAPVVQEDRLINLKLPAVQAYARANGLDRYILNPAKKRLCIITTGKGHMDTMQALQDMGISHAQAELLGIAVYKVALVWPLEDKAILAMAGNVEEILVVEEKRGVIEDQIRKIFYNLPEGRRPRVVGKTDEAGAPLLTEHFELNTAQIADAILSRVQKFADVSAFAERLKPIKFSSAFKGKPAPVVRMPFYCSGCPHNTSTVVPEGSRGLAGIGCHYMVVWQDRRTGTFTQMGGEGVPWIGMAPFTDEKHIFTNLGDGTYFHSGILAIRAAVASSVNITYKILYNDAVAMTGGQPVDGELSVPQLVDQVAAEGVKKIWILSDQPEKYAEAGVKFPNGVSVGHRDELDKVQKILRDIPGTTVLIYDQTCAAEKRRRRKRKLMDDPAKRIFINEKVCEGCGDCGKKSNCMSIAPAETEFGRKRQIDQSSCNKDYSCVKGFCPSFVSVIGGDLKKPEIAKTDDAIESQFIAMPEPEIKHDSVALLVTGIGGTGVITIGAILAMAAHLEGKGATTIDNTGLAQKGGAVTSHVRIAAKPDDIATVRIGVAGATVVLGCDILVTADGENLSKMRASETKVVLNTHKTQTGEFTKNTEWKIPDAQIIDSIKKISGDGNFDSVKATEIATALMGDSIATNMFMVGYGWQKGYIPLKAESILKAIELNGVGIKMNQNAFIWGRRAAWDAARVEKIALPDLSHDPAYEHRRPSQNLDETIARRVEFLTGYQNASYAATYKSLVDQVIAADTKLNGKPGTLSENVAKYYSKLMAYKDEYEVARLYTDGSFLRQIKNTFAGDYKVVFNLAPPLLAKRDEKGHLQKREFGPWMMSAFGVLAKMKFLRGTALDVFGYTEERKMERRLIADYARMINDILPRLNAANYSAATALAAIPEDIRGYGHVKEEHLLKAKAKEAELLKKFQNPQEPQKRAA
jgi:indolepyruvate ferredoxin oxidoreductase